MAIEEKAVYGVETECFSLYWNRGGSENVGGHGDYYGLSCAPPGCLTTIAAAFAAAVSHSTLEAHPVPI